MTLTGTNRQRVRIQVRVIEDCVIRIHHFEDDLAACPLAYNCGVLLSAGVGRVTSCTPPKDVLHSYKVDT